jgi:hypothetical protein
MSRAAKYPTLSFLKMNYLFEILQLSVTLAAQLGIILSTKGQGTGTFAAIVVMNVAYSSLMLCLKIVDMYLKWSLLRGAAKSEDCPAAQEAWKNVVVSDKDADNNDGSLEMGTLHAQEGAAGNIMSASFRDGSLMANPMHHVTTSTGAAGNGGDSKSKQEQRGGGEDAEGGSEREALLARFNQMEATMEDFKSRQTGFETVVGDVHRLNTAVEELQQQQQQQQQVTSDCMTEKLRTL